ncbi:MAG: NAD(P)H-hydrate dehydratase [Chitinophagaceae bacterium]
MKIFNAAQIRAWDEYTITNEPISPLELMERAAEQCVTWILKEEYSGKPFAILCGTGNNGGDGLAIARLLMQKNYEVTVYILESEKPGSAQFEANLQRLYNLNANLEFIENETQLPYLSNDTIVIDALFGTGLRQSLSGLAATLVDKLNAQNLITISIDLPSGMFPDQSSNGNVVIKATHTLTFQVYKLALLIAENAHFFGDVHLMDIQLHPDYPKSQETTLQLVEQSFIKSIYKKRTAFSHKGKYGHCLIVAGSYGKIGAAVLATSACLRSGSGLVTTFLPRCGYAILQLALPEAMVLADDNQNLLSTVPELTNFDALAIGPGTGTALPTQKVVADIVTNFTKPMVIDADGLNCLALQPYLLTQLNPFTILTPHPKEFDRLFGEQKNDFDRMELALQKAKELNVIIVLKGHHTLIATPSGKGFVNNTGNAGLAKGGTGDVLTGLIASLIGQNYSTVDAAIVAVYLHGVAADFAALKIGQEAMTSSDVVFHFASAFRTLNEDK